MVYGLSRGQRLPALQQGRVRFKGGSLTPRDRSQGSRVSLDVRIDLSHRACYTFLPSLLNNEKAQQLWAQADTRGFQSEPQRPEKSLFSAGACGILFFLLLSFTVSTPAQEVHRISVPLVRTCRLHSSAHTVLSASFGLETEFAL